MKSCDLKIRQHKFACRGNQSEVNQENRDHQFLQQPNWVTPFEYHRVSTIAEFLQPLFTQAHVVGQFMHHCNGNLIFEFF
jgi:hypothetical protein